MLKTKKKKTKKTEIDSLNEQLTDLDVKLRTALADYQNLKKELEKQHELKTAMVKKSVFSDLIDLFSDIFFAVEQLPKETQEDSNISGVFLILNKYHDLLKNHGVSEILFSEGDDYDAGEAEVLGVVAHPELNHKVAQTIQPGYKIGEVMIKPAKVMIYKVDKKVQKEKESQDSHSSSNNK